MGMGVLMAALSNCELLKIDFFQRIGKYTLGIYASHFLFIDLLGRIRHSNSSALWEIGFVFIVLALSTVFVFVLSKIKTFRPFVQDRFSPPCQQSTAVRKVAPLQKAAFAKPIVE